MKTRRSGFTLLELLVVIGIIGLLVSLAAVAYSTAQKSTRDSRRRADIKAIRNAMEQYYAGNTFVYPAACASLDSATYFENDTRPVDPGSYTYTYSCAAASYCVCAQLERGGGNSNAANCTAWVASGGSHYCVKNLQ